MPNVSPNVPSVEEYLAQIAEFLQIQQSALFDLETRIQALERVCQTIPGFASPYREALQAAVQDVGIIQARDAGIRLLDAIALQLRRKLLN